MFSVDLINSTITIFYVKMALADFFMYIGALVGFYKNYRSNIAIHEAQLIAISMTAEDKKEALKIARYKYIRDNAKVHYMKIKKMAEMTDNKMDDKLLSYLESFYSAMVTTFGAPPTKEEIVQMVEKSTEIHEEIKPKVEAVK